jgi:hypothetical protein
VYPVVSIPTGQKITEALTGADVVFIATALG